MLRNLLLTVTALAAAGCASTSPEAAASDDEAVAAAIVEVKGFGDNPGRLRMYEHAPRGLARGAPVVLVLHGCMQSATDAARTGWNTLSDELGFVVVYPEQQTVNNGMRCFNWAGEFGDPENLQRDRGENRSLKQMVDRAIALHDADARRVFVVGFSGGGAEASLAAAVWPDVFAGAAILAGIPYHCTTDFLEVSSCLSPGKDRSAAEWGKRVRDAFPGYGGPYPRISIWHGSADRVVAPANRTQLVRQWTNVHGLPAAPTVEDSVSGHRRALFQDADGRVRVESYAIEGMGHGVPVTSGGDCGSTGTYALDAGICAARRIAEFFDLGRTEGR